MVAIVTGNDLGLAGSSASTLGSSGQLGNAVIGPGGEAAYVNAQTGNLVLQRQDELLIGIGPDIGIVRTYNSNGTFDFDNNDSWQLSLYRQLSSLTGTVNTAGSTITRTGADGAQLIYSYDSTNGSPTFGQYVNKDGGGSYDTLTYSSGNDTWTWTDGNSRMTETYGDGATGTWRITGLADTDGNSLTYSYDGNGLITEVVGANGEKTSLIYNGAAQLTRIDVTTAGSITTTRVYYTYDGQGRLQSVMTDLTPDDNSIVDGHVYTTSYTYDGTSSRIASITNTDGTNTSFTYDASGRVETITDGLGHVTTLTYSAGTTAVTDASGQTTTLTHDAAGQLTRIQGPVGSGQDISYSYNANGDVTQYIDSRGNTVDYTYDANGNLTRQQDSAGNVTERRYDDANQLLSETVYAIPDPDGNGAGTASAPQTTRYAYDGEHHLRFVISPEGRVVEYRYNAQGQRIASIQYTSDSYSVAGLTLNDNLTEAVLVTWLQNVDSSQSQRVDLAYDARGQVTTRTTYAQVDASGNGIADGSHATTHYTYDQSGNLLQTIDARGVATTDIANDYLTSYTYDGLNRLRTQTDALGNTTTTVYNDANRQVVMTLANGLVTTSTYDQTGRLLSVARHDINGALGSTSYVYDALGNVRQVTDPLGQKTTYLYDSLGRKVGEIDAERALTEIIYNANGQVIRTVRYASLVDAAALTGDATQFTLAGVSPVTDNADRVTYHLYDEAGRLTKQIDAQGAVTQYHYDGTGRLVSTVNYANLLSTVQLAALRVSTTEILPSDSDTIAVADAADDRYVRQFYSDDGLLLATLDAEGYLSEHFYNAAGQHISVLRYSTQSPSAQWEAGTLAALRPTLDAVQDQRSHSLYNARGQLTGTVDAEGYLTEYQYDLVGNRIATIRYATGVTYVAGNTVEQSRPADAATNPENQTQILAYDASNRLVRLESHPDNLITTYAYDDVGNLTTTVKAAGAVEERAAQRRYNSLGQVVAELGGEGVAALAALGSNPTSMQIDDVWNLYGTRYIYDAAGRRTAMITPDGSTTTGHRSVYYYDADGRLTHRINALGEVIEYRYNAFDDRTAERRYDTRIDTATLATLNGGSSSTLGTAISDLVAGGYSETGVVYGLRGQVSSTMDALGNVNTRSYNAFGELVGLTTQIDATNSLLTAYDYDRRGQLTQTTEDVGGFNRILSAIYDAFGRQTQSTDARGGVLHHQYDRLGREIVTIDANSMTYGTTYDAFARVLTRTDGRGHVTSYSYDSASRAMTLTTAEGVVTVTIRNRHGETVSVTDGRSNTTTYAYDQDGRLTSITAPNGTTSTAYDAAGQVIATENANGIATHYTYDAAGRTLSRAVDPAGLNLITQYRYDAQGRTAWIQDANGIWTKTDYDAKGQVTAIVVDPTSVPDVDGTLIANANGLNLQTAYTYDARGKRLTVTEGANSSQPRTTQYLYDKLGRRTQQIADPSGLNLATVYTYDGNDNVVARTDAHGFVTRFTYDAGNRLIDTIDAGGVVSRHAYDANGNLLSTTAYANAISVSGLPVAVGMTDIDALIVTDSADRVTSHVYDQDNRRSFTIDAAGYVTAYSYDANGNVTGTTQYANVLYGTLPDGTPQVAADSAKDRTTLYVYDNANRVTDITDAEGHITHHVYDAAGHIIDTIRAYGTADASQTRYGYDAAGRVIDETRAYGTTDASTTHYVYDALGQQIAITEAYGTSVARTTTQEFDAAGRKLAAVDALGHRTSTEYNAVGDIVKVTDALGAVGYFYNDALGRVTLQVDPEGAVIEHRYDALGNETETIRYATRVTGTLTAETMPVVTLSADDQHQLAAYDALGRRTEIQTWWGTGTSDYYTETFAYDAFGNVVSATARNGAITTYVYDRLDRKTAEILPVTSRDASGIAIPVENRYAYDMAGNLVSKTEAYGLPEQRITTYVYDRLGRQVQEIGESFSAFNPVTQANVTVTPTSSRTYDGRGNLTTDTDANGNTAHYYYDTLDRRVGMVGADGTYTDWTYDAVGNKLSQTVYATPVSNPTIGIAPTVTPDTGNDRTVHYSYDLAGRQTGTAIHNISTGVYNTVTGQYQVSTGNLTTTTVYDALGNVVRTVDANGNITRHWYNSAGQTVAKVDALGYLTIWTRDTFGNIASETRYANQVQLMGAANLDSGVPQVLTVAPESGSDAIYVISNSVNDRSTDMVFDRLNRVTSESVRNVASGSVNTTNGVLTTTVTHATTTYVYDGLNNITQKTDATNATTDWLYDGLGRRLSQINPQFTDYTGAVVRPRTDVEYDGLSNVRREIARGTDSAVAATISGQVETDDHITTYTYTTGGRLAAETDATGAVTEYRYDANGNITQTLLKNRADADGALTDDITLFHYDQLNRQVKSRDVSTGLISEVQYNGFNQIDGKRSYVGAAPTVTDPNNPASGWQEFAQYDQAGRAWKSNTGDGVTKVYLHDANGNATLMISGTLDMNTLSLAQVLNQKAMDTQNNVTQQTMYTFSVFDTRNQLTNTIQPSMTAQQNIVVVQANTTGQTFFVGNNATIQIGASTVQGGATTTDPVTAGTVDVGFGNLSWSSSFNSSSSTVNTTIVVPNSLGLGTDDVAITVTQKIFITVKYATWGYIPDSSNPTGGSYGVIWVYESGSITNTQTKVISATQNSVNFSKAISADMVRSGSTLVSANLNEITIKVLKKNAQGDISVLNEFWPQPSGTSGSAPLPKKLYLTGQPSSATRLVMAYRSAGSAEGYTFVNVSQMVNTAGAAMAGMFAFDWSSLAADNYEYHYIALDANGSILNQQSGTFNTTNASAPTVSAQTPIGMGGAGRAVVSSPSLTINGNSIIKTGGEDNVWDTDVYSTTSMTGGAYVSARAGQTTLEGMFGLNADPTTDRHYTSLDYAWRTRSGGALHIYENGIKVGEFGTYTTSDILSIVYEGSTVRYLKNGVVLRTVSTTSDRTFYFDSSLYNTGYALNDIEFSQPTLTTGFTYDTSLTTASTTVTINGSSITKTGGSDIWTDADAYSQSGLVGGASISATAGQLDKSGMFGLNADPTTNANYTSLDYAWETRPDGTLRISENGNNIGSFGTYTTSDVLSIVYEGTTVSYLVNGEVKRTRNTSEGRTFYFDSSFKTVGYTLNNVQFTTTTTTAPAVTINGNSIIKTGAENNLWDGDAYSTTSMTGSAYVSARAGQTTLQGMFGLNADPTTDSSHASLDYAWYTTTGGALQIYENGIKVGDFGNYTTSDILSIVYEGNTVRYLKNGVVLRTVNTTSDRTFYFDSSLYSTGFIYNNIQWGTSVLASTSTIGNINFVEQGNATVGLATSLTLKYRVKDSGSAWTTQALSPNILSGVETPGWFTIPWNTFAAGTEYEFDLVATNANGVEVNRARTTLQWAGDIPQIGALLPYSTQVVTFTERPSTEYLDISYRVSGSNDDYITVRITPNVAGFGIFQWNANNLFTDPAADYDYDIIVKAYDAGDLLNNHTNATLRLGANAGVVDSTHIPLPTLLRLTPSQEGVAYLDLGYRLKGSDDDYTPLVAVAYDNNGTLEYRAELPPGLTAGAYEYRYTAYAADTYETDPDLIVTPDDPETVEDETVYGTMTITHALGTTSGDFTVAAESTAASSLDWVINSGTQTSTIHRQQSYNAFGEVITETDGRGNTTQFEYNALGKLTLKRDPETDITLNNGFVQRANPETSYTYDLGGRLIAVQDANGNLNTLVSLNGSDTDRTIFERHADGGIVTRKYDIFGNLRQATDEAGHQTDYQYDAMDRLTRIDRPQRLADTDSYLASRAYDIYTYDAAGQRISHTNALGDTEKIYYDALGRITQTKSYLGFNTFYTYVYSDAIVGLGGLTVGGWSKTTTNATGRTLIDHTDVFGHMTWHKDLGGHEFTYNYNRAGWLTSQTGTSGQNIEYSHYANGYIESIWDKAMGTYTRYEYDANGNRTFEGYITLKNPLSLAMGAKDYYQYANIEYDELNRMTRMLDPKADIRWEYDAVGNRRMVRSVYHDGVNGAMRVQEYWYSYDAMNRFTITMGQLAGGDRATSAGQAINIVTGTTGVAIAYNFAGQRMQAINGSDNSVETYSYTADGYLEDVNINGTLRARRVSDALGRVITYREYNGSGSQIYVRHTNYDKDNRVLKENGTDGTTDYYYYNNITDSDNSKTGTGALARTINVNTVDGSTTTVRNDYDYQYWDEAKQDDITTSASNTMLKKNNQYWQPGYSDLRYDVNGHLIGAVDRVGGRSFRYVTDAQGQILLRDEIAGKVVNRVDRYYYVDGKRVGDIGNDGPSRTDYVTALAQHKKALNNKTSIIGNRDKYANFKPIASADFDQNYEPISPSYPGATPGNYVVRNGDTLQSIALAVWGDSAMWYLIADANGLDSTQSLTPGLSLVIPNKVTNIHNNSSTYRVYNPGEAIGDVSPTLPDAPPPPKEKEKCGGLGSIIVMIVAVVATIYTAGALAGSAAAALNGGVFGAGVAALGGGVSTFGFAAGALAGAVGSVAGQIAGNVLGVQDGFSWSAVAAGAIGAGIGAVGGINISSGIPGKIASAVAGNLVSQSVGIITGAQKGFSWAGVAASAIAAPITSSISKSISTSSIGGAGPAGFALRGALAGVATSTVNELTRVAISGGKVSWANVAIGGIQGGIYGYAEGLGNQARVSAAVQASSGKQAPGTGVMLSQAEGMGVMLDGANMPWGDIGVFDEYQAPINFQLTDKSIFTGQRIDLSGLADVAFSGSVIAGGNIVYGADAGHTPGLRSTGIVLTDYQNKLAQIQNMDIKRVFDPDNPNQYLIMIHTDGTRNDPGQAIPTNVHQLLQLVRESGSANVRAIYAGGVGTDFDAFGLNSASGTGVLKQVEDTYRETIKEINRIYDDNPNAEFVFAHVGFSRGANTARILQNRLVQEGIPLLSSGRTIKSPLGTEIGTQYDQYIVPKGTANIGVSVLFDTVDTGIGSLFNQSIPSQSVQGLHLTAINEYRSSFSLTSILDKNGRAPRGWIEMAVYGAHTNIGGGSYDTNGIGAMNLKLAYTYLERAGVPLAPLTAELGPNYDSFVIYDSRFVKNTPFIDLVNNSAQQRTIKYMP